MFCAKTSRKCCVSSDIDAPRHQCINCGLFTKTLKICGILYAVVLKWCPAPQKQAIMAYVKICNAAVKGHLNVEFFSKQFCKEKPISQLMKGDAGYQF